MGVDAVVAEHRPVAVVDVAVALTVSCRMTDHGAEQPQLPASQSVWQSAVDGSVADGSMHAALQPLRSVTSNAKRISAAF